MKMYSPSMLLEQAGDAARQNVSAKDRIAKFVVILRELGRIPEYSEEAERLFRHLRSRNAFNPDINVEVQVPRAGDRGRLTARTLAGVPS